MGEPLVGMVNIRIVQLSQLDPSNKPTQCQKSFIQFVAGLWLKVVVNDIKLEN